MRTLEPATNDNTREGMNVIRTMMGWLWTLGAVAATLLPAMAPAQDDGVCARVKLEIKQQLTFERVGFEGRLRVSNDSQVDLRNVQVELVVYTANGDIPTSPAFFIQAPRIEGMLGTPDGNGVIPAGATAAIDYLFIPAVYAGGENATGERYYIGGAMSAVAEGEVVDYPLIPDDVTVLPQPKLDIDYFLTRDVESDDPFTLDQIEEQVPFDLGVRIRNVGWGNANKMVLSSGQPKIIDNEKGLLVAFRLLQAFTHGSLIGDPALTMNFGNIPAQSARVGRWSMVSTLMGTFIEFDATYTHSADLGGELTSLIVSLDSHFLVKTALIDEPGFDEVEDFLADTNKDDDDPNPDTLFSSEGQEYPVNTVAAVAQGVPTAQNPTVRVVISDAPSGWIYTRIPDPSQGLLNLISVRRTDNKQILTPQNAWTTRKVVRLVGQPSRVEHSLHLLDLNTTGEYLLTFQTPPPDSTPPITNVIVQEPVHGSFPTYYGTPETEVVLFATDDVSGVANTLWSVDGSPYVAAYPLRLSAPGPHSFEFYSVDRAGNAESAREFTLVVDDGAPVVDEFRAAAEFTPAVNPRGEAALFVVTAAGSDDRIPVVDLTLEVVPQAGGNPVHTETARRSNGARHLFFWDGRLTGGAPAIPGVYTLKLVVSDPLGHSTTTTQPLVIHEPFASTPLAASAADQMFVDVDGNLAVWQDNRSGHWDIWLHDFTAGTSRALVAGAGNQTRPRISGTRVVYQDDASGSSDVMMIEVGPDTITPVAATAAAESRPDVWGSTVVWQQNGDIWLRDLASLIPAAPIVANAQPQENPRIHGSQVVWDDLRNGLADVYLFDIPLGRETRLTNNVEQQNEADVRGGMVAWTDKRTGNRDIHTLELAGSVERRLLGAAYDEAEPALGDGYLALTSFVAGLADSNVALQPAGYPVPLVYTTHPSAQRRASTAGLRLAWEDQRAGVWQIRGGDLRTPIADAGADRVTGAGQETTLSAAGTDNPSGAPATYLWTQVAGPAVDLNDPTAASPTFIAPAVSTTTRLVFTVVVTVDGRSSAPDTVVIEVRAGNQPPLADAGADQTVPALATVLLDGSGSSDPDNDPLLATWTVLSSPTVTLTNSNTLTPAFVAPEVTTPTLVLVQLVVNDGQYDSLPDTVRILINPRINRAPVAVVAGNQSVNEGAAVTLDAASSYDPDGDAITWAWRQISGTPVVLANPATPRPTFTAPEVPATGNLVFGVKVSDGRTESPEALVVVEVRNVRKAPVANAGPDQSVLDTAPITLDGSASYHPDNLPIQYLWTQISGPRMTLSSNSVAKPTFTPMARSLAYDVEFSLTVFDDLQASQPDRVRISVRPLNTYPVANAGPDRVVRAPLGRDVMITLDGSASSDAEQTELSYRWTQVSGPAVIILDNRTATPRFIVRAGSGANESTPIVLRLVVNDGLLDSPGDNVKITIQPYTDDSLTIY